MPGWNETPIQRTIRIRRMRGELAAWLRTFAWTHWATLTVARTETPGRLRQIFDNEFVRFATKLTQDQVTYAFVIEGGALGDRPHLHALLACGLDLAATRLERAWRHGLARVQAYDPQRGGARYLAKQIGSVALDWGLSSRRPPTLNGSTNAVPKQKHATTREP